MIYIDKDSCIKCNLCLSNFSEYCINEEAGFPVVDTEICNQCQKCIAICPQRAIRMNGVMPERIEGNLKIGYDDLISLLRMRHSTKKFQEREVPADIVRKIAESAKYAPNQNKNIDILIIDDPLIIRTVNDHALIFIGRMYNLLFSNRPATAFIELFTGPLGVIKKKMERDLDFNKQIVKKNTQVLMLAVGNPRIPVTEMSAQYLLSIMSLTAESLDIGCTLMDSLKLTFNRNRIIRNNLGIKSGDKVLGVLALGYSDENIVNIPVGYEVKLFANNMKNSPGYR